MRATLPRYNPRRPLTTTLAPCPGNIDWRPLINLWSVLEYLSKYTAKVGKATQHLGKLFGNVVETVCSFESEDGIHDLWRRTIMKFYNKILGDRDYSLF